MLELKTEHIYSIEEAPNILLEKVKAVFPDLEMGQVKRIEIKVEDTDVLTWLKQQTKFPKVYWRDREAEFEMAGIGYIDNIRTQGHIDYDFL